MSLCLVLHLFKVILKRPPFYQNEKGFSQFGKIEGKLSSKKSTKFLFLINIK